MGVAFGNRQVRGAWHPAPHPTRVPLSQTQVAVRQGQADRATIERACLAAANSSICRLLALPYVPRPPYARSEGREAAEESMRRGLANVSRQALHDSSDVAIGKETGFFWPRVIATIAWNAQQRDQG